MKKLLLILAIILLGVVVYFQYQQYKRFNPPSNYTYEISPDIDVNYFDPIVLQKYYDNAYELSAYGRKMWVNEGIDVLYPNEDEQSIRAANYYNQKLSTQRKLQDLLTHSTSLKKKGFDNKQIKHIIENGLSPASYELLSNQQYVGLALGDESQEVWDIQKMFIALGYEIPKDGKFGVETETAIKDYQIKNDMYASGRINKQTLKLLLKVK